MIGRTGRDREEGTVVGRRGKWWEGGDSDGKVWVGRRAVMGRRGSDGKEGTVMGSRGTVMEGEDRGGEEGTERGE